MNYFNQITGLQNIINIANSPAIQATVGLVNSPAIQLAYQNARMSAINQSMIGGISRMTQLAAGSYINMLPENMAGLFKQMPYFFNVSGQLSGYLDSSVKILSGVLKNYHLLYCYPDDMPDEEAHECEEANNKIVTEIFTPDQEKEIILEKSPIIRVLPVNENVLKYLSEHPELFYQLSGRKFEIVMAEIYSKLGYHVELTQATHDGGKDIIIRKPDILGDFIYYVECKKYAAGNPVGVGIVREMAGTIYADKVNGGILATTSYFTPDAKRYVIDNKYNYQIQLHDYDKIKRMLNRIV